MTEITASADPIARKTDNERLKEIAATVLAKARSHGADAADAIILEAESTSASCRMGAIEDIERSESRDLGLRVFVGQSVASVSSTSFDPSDLEKMAERAVAMARVAPPDPHGGLADPDALAVNPPDLDLFDGRHVSAIELNELARRAEDSALAVEGITNSLGAGAACGVSGVVLATSHGFVGSYCSSSFSVSCSVVAGTGTEMERDYDYSQAIHFDDLGAPEDIGRIAGKRTVRRLNPRKKPSQNVPVVYDRRVSGGMVSHLSSAVNGASIARGTSFLKEKMGERIFAPGISIMDEPHRVRGLRSKPFDAEGVGNTQLSLVENGTLKSWLLDSRTSRQLGLGNNGRASRGIGGPPSPSATNLYMTPGSTGFEDLLADIGEGLYITDLIGMGVNGINGDYSRGAAGFWIENGEIAYPVSEITVAGNLNDMFANLTAADDLEFRYGVNAPTLRIEGMTVAGT